VRYSFLVRILRKTRVTALTLRALLTLRGMEMGLYTRNAQDGPKRVRLYIFNLHNLRHTSKAFDPEPTVLCSISNTCIWNKYLKHTDVLAMFWDMTDLCMKCLKVEWGKPTGSREENNSNVTWFRFRKWWWLYCTQTGSRWQRKMKIERKDGKALHQTNIEVFCIFHLSYREYII